MVDILNVKADTNQPKGKFLNFNGQNKALCGTAETYLAMYVVFGFCYSNVTSVKLDIMLSKP